MAMGTTTSKTGNGKKKPYTVIVRTGIRNNKRTFGFIDSIRFDSIDSFIPAKDKMKTNATKMKTQTVVTTTTKCW